MVLDAKKEDRSKNGERIQQSCAATSLTAKDLMNMSFVDGMKCSVKYKVV